MLDAIGTRDNIASWVDAALARGDRLMGFGHRVYRVRDPRADVLKRAVETLDGTIADLGLAAEVEAYAREALARAKPDRRLDTNVEFYTAILLDALSIPRKRLHAGLCRGAHRRLDGARPRTAAHRPPVAARLRLCRQSRPV